MRENIHNYKILTPNGWKPFKGIVNKGKQPLLRIVTNNTEISCTKNHMIYINEDSCVEASKLIVGDTIYSKNGYETIVEMLEKESDNVYDILDVDDGNKFFCNDILVHNCEFVGNSQAIVNADILKEILDRTRNIDPLYIIDGDVRFFKQIEPNMKYLVALDPSLGVEGDSSAIQIFEFPTFIQAGEWLSDKHDQNKQVDKIKTIVDWLYQQMKDKGNHYPEIYWSFENNTAGEGINVCLKERSNEDGVYIKRGQLINEDGNKRMGFTTDKRSKAMACSQLKIKIETGQMIINSKLYAQQLSNFTLQSTSYAARTGEHDDLITSSLIIIMMYLQMRSSVNLDIPSYTINETKSSINEDFDTPFILDIF